MSPCRDMLLMHSRVDHEVMREAMGDGRCPICDPTVTREEYAGAYRRVADDPELRRRMLRR